MFNKLKQIKDLRDQANQLKNMLAQEVVQGQGKNGKIVVVMDGNQQITSIDIAEDLLAPEHKKDVEEGVKEAAQNAIREVQKLMAQKMRQGEIDIPNLS